MLGSSSDAEDAVQESLVRAWRGRDGLEENAALRGWLHRIATNVCFDMLDGRKRRGRPVDLSAPSTELPSALVSRGHDEWIEPMADRLLGADEGGDPAQALGQKQSVRLAFVAMLQHLPPRQRAVLILREVLGFEATEVAEMLQTTVASVTSALQRARQTLSDRAVSLDTPPPPLDAPMRALLDRYVDTFERYDIEALTELLHAEATMSMPPYDLTLVGRELMSQWLLGPGSGCRGSRLVETRANGGMPAFGQYRPSPEGGHRAWALQVLDVKDGRVTDLISFLDVERIFPLFELPLALPAPK